MKVFSESKLNLAVPSRKLGGLGGAAVELEIGVAFETALVIGEEFHGFVGFEAIAFDGGVDLGFDVAGEFIFVPLGEGEDFADGAAFDDFLDVPAIVFVFVEEDVGFVDATEEIMEVAHDVLVGAHEEEA